MFRLFRFCGFPMFRLLFFYKSQTRFKSSVVRTSFAQIWTFISRQESFLDFLLQRVLKSFLRIFVSLCFCCLYYRRTVSFCQYIFFKNFILFFCYLLIVLLYRIILIICFSMPSAPEPYSIQKGCWKGEAKSPPFQQPPYLIHGPYAI